MGVAQSLMKPALVRTTKGSPVLNTLPNSDPSIGSCQSSLKNPLLSGKSMASKGFLREDWQLPIDRKSTRLNSSHTVISYAVFCLKKKKNSRCTGDGDAA